MMTFAIVGGVMLTLFFGALMTGSQPAHGR
jgi:hypothetical protein